MKLRQYLSAAVLLGAVLTLGAQAASPYQSYNHTEWVSDVPAPDAYRAAASYTGPECGTTPFKTPGDLAVEEDTIYLLDSGNNRIVLLDREMHFQSEITALDNQGTPDALNAPEGLFVDGEGGIYVADTGNKRCLKLDAEGRVLQVYTKPAHDSYANKDMIPKRVLVDGLGMVYILAENEYQGALLYRNDGTFVSFYGAPKLQVTPKILIDRLWKKLLTQQQADKISNHVPVEFTSFDIDSENFVYTCSSYTETDTEQLRCLNMLGNNVYENTENFGEPNKVYYKQSVLSTTFVDVAVDDSRVLFAADSTRGRIYAVDPDGYPLFSFGTTGLQLGSFGAISAIDRDENDRVYVLDFQKGSITCMDPTSYGQAILSAARLHAQGRFEEAVTYWEEVLRLNGNSDIALEGIGKAKLLQKDYEGANEYFRMAVRRESESVSFEGVRKNFLRRNTPVIVVVLALLLTAVILLTSKKFRRWLQERPRRKKGGDAS